MQKLGLFLIIFSFLPWAVIALLPILPLAVAQKALLVPAMAVSAEVFFWVGVALAGKEVAAKYGRYFSPRFIGQWMRKKVGWL